ncbi:hypothetical protein ACUXAR_001018 [Staphylococcus saprophyticus]|jgi:hypothetical protein
MYLLLSLTADKGLDFVGSFFCARPTNIAFFDT